MNVGFLLSPAVREWPFSQVQYRQKQKALGWLHQ